MSNGTMGFMFGALFGFIIGACSFGISLDARHKSNLIARDLAQYCPDDGRFAFKGECDK